MTKDSIVITQSSQLKKWTVRGLLTLSILIIGSLSYIYFQLQNSLALLNGQIELPGLISKVVIERDDLGVPAITGENRIDIAYGLGFLHAQERFFQMDLMRRQSAGELSELFGEKALPLDKKARIHRFRHRAQKFIADLEEDMRAFLLAYTKGVNSGLAQFSSAPFEYLLLQQTPIIWQPEDTYLVVYAMYMLLQNSAGRAESNLALMRDLLPVSLFDFLTPLGTHWDAALDETVFQKQALPDAQEYFAGWNKNRTISSVVKRRNEGHFLEISDELKSNIGSNNWAVSGKLTKHGGAIVANDMHLPISVPNTWYRASFIIKGEQANERLISGITLPGTPNMITGSTDNIAWAFTNAYGDWSDLIILDIDVSDESRYLTPEGYKRFEKMIEPIKIKGAKNYPFEFEETIWGPVIDKDHRGRKRVYRWVAHLAGAVNMNLLELESAKDIYEAIEIAHRSGIPEQNFVVGDKDGNIAWTIIGVIPKRIGLSGELPQSWSNGEKRWDGWLQSDEYPVIVNPESGRIWSANSRMVGGEMYKSLYDGSYALGARGKQIRDGLFAKESFNEQDMLDIQRDNRALFLARWRDMLLGLLDNRALSLNPSREEFKTLLQQWEARASISSKGYRLVKAYRKSLAQVIFDGLLAELKEADPSFKYMGTTTHQYEAPLWAMVTEQPEYLLLPGYGSWRGFLLAHVDSVITELGAGLADKTWDGQINVTIRHPFSTVIPFIGKWLDVPARPMDGDIDMPFVQYIKQESGKVHGASERSVVSPGKENEAYFNMPTGQSGHPLSPFYNKGHEAWVNGEPTPFLPQLPQYRLELAPEKTE